MCFWLISSRKPMCSTLFYRFAELSNCLACEPISSIEIDVGAVRVKVSHWQDSIPLSSRLCPSFSSRSPHRRPRVFRLVYRPYRSFRFVFSSFVVSPSFVSFASRLVSSLVSCFALHSPPFLYLYYLSTYFFSRNNFPFLRVHFIL